jgi:hypothetical protein
VTRVGDRHDQKVNPADHRELYISAQSNHPLGLLRKSPFGPPGLRAGFPLDSSVCLRHRAQGALTISIRRALVPWWARDASGSAKRVNPRSETAATKAAFGDALKSKRCIVPADGFNEWQKTRTGKQPYCFEVNNGELFAFAGCGIAGRIWTARPQRRGSITDDCAERRNIRRPRPDARNP